MATIKLTVQCSGCCSYLIPFTSDSCSSRSFALSDSFSAATERFSLVENARWQRRIACRVGLLKNKTSFPSLISIGVACDVGPAASRDRLWNISSFHFIFLSLPPSPLLFGCVCFDPILQAASGMMNIFQPPSIFPNRLDQTSGTAVQGIRVSLHIPGDPSRGRRHFNRFRPTSPVQRRLSRFWGEMWRSEESRSSWRLTRSRSVWHLKDVFRENVVLLSSCGSSRSLGEGIEVGTEGGGGARADATVHIMHSCLTLTLRRSEASVRLTSFKLHVLDLSQEASRKLGEIWGGT